MVVRVVRVVRVKLVSGSVLRGMRRGRGRGNPPPRSAGVSERKS